MSISEQERQQQRDNLARTAIKHGTPDVAAMQWATKAEKKAFENCQGERRTYISQLTRTRKKLVKHARAVREKQRSQQGTPVAAAAAAATGGGFVQTGSLPSSTTSSASASSASSRRSSRMGTPMQTPVRQVQSQPQQMQQIGVTTEPSFLKEEVLRVQERVQEVAQQCQEPLEKTLRLEPLLSLCRRTLCSIARLPPSAKEVPKELANQCAWMFTAFERDFPDESFSTFEKSETVKPQVSATRETTQRAAKRDLGGAAEELRQAFSRISASARTLPKERNSSLLETFAEISTPFAGHEVATAALHGDDEIEEELKKLLGTRAEVSEKTAATTRSIVSTQPRPPTQQQQLPPPALQQLCQRIVQLKSHRMLAMPFFDTVRQAWFLRVQYSQRASLPFIVLLPDASFSALVQPPFVQLQQQQQHQDLHVFMRMQQWAMQVPPGTAVLDAARSFMHTLLSVLHSVGGAVVQQQPRSGY